MNTIGLAISIGCMMSILHEFKWYQDLLCKMCLQFKPFSCAMCTAFWISLTLGLMTQNYWLVAFSPVSYVSANVANYYANRL